MYDSTNVTGSSDKNLVTIYSKAKL